MFDFRLFPGTNFNRINLDWIFSKLKELQAGQSTVTEAAEEATAAAEEATTAAAAATQAASDAIEAIETVTETAEDAQTRARAAELTAARAESNANTAISNAADAAAAAASAQQTADGAVTAAATAQQTANGAATAAAAAATAAAAAQQTADSAVITDSGAGYCRFPDGTQICWKSVTASDIAITKTWGNLYESTEPLNFGTWPVAFVSAPAVSIIATSNAMTVESVRQTSATDIGNGYVYRPTSGTYAGSFSIIGVGRWK